MEAIAQAADAETVRKMLGSIVTAYTAWIAAQRTHIPTDSPHREQIAKELLDRAEIASYRIASGLQALDDPKVLEAFQIANRAIATSIRQRSTHDTDKSPDELSPPKWRPFQLAFLLMNIARIANPLHSDNAPPAAEQDPAAARTGVKAFTFPTWFVAQISDEKY